MREIAGLNDTLGFVAVTLMAQVYSPREICRQAQVSPRLLRSWQQQNLLPKGRTLSHDDLVTLRGLASLYNAGLQGSRLRDAIEWIREEFGSTDIIRDARVVKRGRRTFLKLPGQAVELWSGQLRLRFDTPEAIEFQKHGAGREARKRRLEAEQWFQRGLDLEQEGAPPEEIITAYRTATELDDTSAGAFVNLGTMYFNARLWREAERHYRSAIRADPTYSLAHFNLGNLYDERGDRQRAFKHYEEALRLRPDYADAHYNIALLHQSQGQTMKALKHWRIYLKLDPVSSWSTIARRELKKLQESTVVMPAADGPAIVPSL